MSDADARGMAESRGHDPLRSSEPGSCPPAPDSARVPGTGTAPGPDFSPEVVQAYERLKKEAEAGGYRLNPDREFTLRLVEGLLDNGKRYGYWQCPCRLAFGERAKDLDLICPCDYRDADLNEFGACYCALYVTDDWIAGRKPHKSIPERRPEKFVTEGYSPAQDMTELRGHDPLRSSEPGSCPPAPARDMTELSSIRIVSQPDASPDSDRTPRLPVWRCKVCGYLCARDEPPDKCPICKVSKDRFERFL